MNIDDYKNELTKVTISEELHQNIIDYIDSNNHDIMDEDKLNLTYLKKGKTLKVWGGYVVATVCLLLVLLVNRDLIFNQEKQGKNEDKQEYSNELKGQNDQINDQDKDKPNQNNDNQGQTGGNKEQTDTFQIPEWYTPGKLSVLAIRKEMAQSSSSIAKAGFSLFPWLSATYPNISTSNEDSNSLTLPEGAEIGTEVVDAEFVSLESANEYPDGAGIYYNTKTEEILCFSSIVQEVIEEKGLFPEDGSVGFGDVDPVSGSVQIQVCKSHKPIGYYYYNIYDKRFFKLPIEANHSGSLCLSPDKKYYTATRFLDDDQQEVILIDVSGQSAKMTVIADSKKDRVATKPEALFSDYGKFVTYPIYNENGKPLDEDNFGYFAIYDIQKKTTKQFRGNLVNFINEDSAIVVQTKDGGVVYDPSTGEDITGKIELKNWQKYRVRITHGGDHIIGFKKSATLLPLFDEKEEIMPIKKVDVIATAKEYIYYYNNGEDYITCYSIENGKSFRVAVDQSFLKEAEGIDKTEGRVIYGLGLSRDETKLLLYYTIDTVEYFGSNDTGFIIEELGTIFRTSNSLKDIEAYVIAGKDLNPGYMYSDEYNPYKDIERFYLVKGDGYTSLLAISEGCSFVAVEDYRDRTFTLYVTYSGMPWLNKPEIYDGCLEDITIGRKPYRKVLAKEASQESTLQQYSYLKQRDPYYDYSEYYVDGKLDGDKFDRDKLFNVGLAYEALYAYIYDGKKVNNQAYYGWDIIDRDTLGQLMTKVSELEGYQQPTAYDYRLFPGERYPEDNKGSRMYAITLSIDSGNAQLSEEQYFINIGISKEGKKYIETNAGYLYVKDDVYKELLDLCDILYESAPKYY